MTALISKNYFKLKFVLSRGVEETHHFERTKSHITLHLT